jgi:hypothetical protein
MRDQGRLVPAVRQGLRFLYEHQLSYGEFRTYASPSPDLSVAYFDSSVFVTTLVVYSIMEISYPCVTTMIDRASSFLAREMKGPGMFEYYASRNVKSMDPDLDDTACASVALRGRHTFVAGGGNIGCFVANRDEAGRFYTWVGGADVQNDVDSVVNANVVLYLGDRDETESACRYLVDTIESNREGDSYRYYLDDMTLYYAISRAYARGTASLGKTRTAIVERVLRRGRDDGSFGNELATACAVCTLANFEYGGITRLRSAARYLEEQQGADGSWRRVAMYRQPGTYYGSEELTTALCLEALARVAEM